RAVRDSHARPDRQAVEEDRRRPLRTRVLGSGPAVSAHGGVGRDRRERPRALQLLRYARRGVRIPSRPSDRAPSRADVGAGSAGPRHGETARVTAIRAPRARAYGCGLTGPLAAGAGTAW